MKKGLVRKLIAILTAGLMLCTQFLLIQADTVKSDRIVFHVSPSGSDSNKGTEAAPFATVARASKAVSAVSHKNIPVDVIVHAGKYRLNSTVDLIGETAGGSKNAPVTYKAAGDGEVIFSGFKTVDVNKFTRVTDPEMLERFKEDALPHIGAVSLSEQGFNRDDLDMLLGKTKDRSVPDTLELLVMRLNGKEQYLAQYPNYGEYDTIKEVINKGKTSATSTAPGATFKYSNPNISRWKDPSTAIVKGFMGWVFLEEWSGVESVNPQNKTITLKHHTKPGVQPGRTWRVLNVAEELDVPGEYFIDLNTMTLYFYPPYKISKDDVLEIGVTKDSYFNLSETSNITFDGFKFEGFRLSGEVVGMFTLENCDNIEIRNCIFSHNGGGSGVIIKSGKNTLVEACGFYNCGSLGVTLYNNKHTFAADYPNLEHDNNVIRNNHFYNVGTENIEGAGGAVSHYVTAHYQNNAAVGNVINNNLIHRIQGMLSIQYNGAEYDISYNEIANGMRVLADYGLIYSGNRVYPLGTKVNYNYLHDYGSALDDSYAVNGIYFDDWLSGQTAESNIIVPNSRSATNGLLAVGAFHNIKNNILANSATGLSVSSRTTKVSDNSSLANLVKGFGSLAEPLAKKYPQFAQIPQMVEEVGGVFPTIGHKITGNVSVGAPNRISDLVKEYGTVENNVDTNDISIFVDPDNHDWRIKAAAAKELNLDEGVITDANFDMDKIGIQKDIWDIKNPFESFRQVYPANGDDSVSSKDVMLHWEPALFADEYDYVLATDPELKNVVAEGTTYFEYAKVGDLEPGQSYYWKVKARNVTKQLGGEWESEGVPYLFTIRNFEEVDKNFLGVAIEAADKTFSTVQTESDAIGDYKVGTKAKLNSLLEDAKTKYQKFSTTQQQIDTTIEKLESTINGLGSFKNMGYTTVDTSDASKWATSSATASVTSEDGVLKLSGGSTVYYTEPVPNHNMMKFKTKIDLSSGWAAFALRKNQPEAHVWTGNQYMIAVKPDIFEFQKYNAGASVTGVIETHPNNGIIDNEKWSEVEFYVTDVEGGVHILFKVDGETIFDYYDTEMPLYADGYFGIRPAASSTVTQIMASDDVPEGYYTPPANFSDRGKSMIYTPESAECEYDGRWTSVGSSEKGYNEKGVRVTSNKDVTVKYTIAGTRTDNQMLWYWHEPLEDGDKNTTLTVKYNYDGTGDEVYTRNIDFTAGEPGWVAIGAFPFVSFAGNGSVEVTFTASGEGNMVMPVIKKEMISEDETLFAHLFYRDAHNMTVFKIDKGYAYVNAGKKEIAGTTARIINSKTYIPLRFLADAFGYNVSWDGDEYTATIRNPDTIIKVRPNENYMTVNGQTVYLEGAALVDNERVLIPLRDITQALGKKVLWNNDTQIVVVADRIDFTEADAEKFSIINKIFGGDEDEQ